MGDLGQELPRLGLLEGPSKLGERDSMSLYHWSVLLHLGQQSFEAEKAALAGCDRARLVKQGAHEARRGEVWVIRGGEALEDGFHGRQLTEHHLQVVRAVLDGLHTDVHGTNDTLGETNEGEDACANRERISHG